MMKTIITYTVISSLILSGCAGSLSASKGVNYIYEYTMTQPLSKEMTFRDNYIYIQFKIDASAINFQLQNISEASMSIVWEKVSMGVNKRIFSVRNSSTIYSLSNTLPVPVVIPSLGYVRETIIPRENISYKDGKWVEKDFFLTNDRGSKRLSVAIQKTVNSEISLTLPVKIGDVIVEYPFTFKVKAATALPSNILPPKKDRPEAPKIPMQESSVRPSYIPILIAVGIFGISAYFLSKKERTPSDL
jgi:hypothetical protein